jgi:hypothetical protein
MDTTIHRRQAKMWPSMRIAGTALKIPLRQIGMARCDVLKLRQWLRCQYDKQTSGLQNNASPDGSFTRFLRHRLLRLCCARALITIPLHAADNQYERGADLDSSF